MEKGKKSSAKLQVEQCLTACGAVAHSPPPALQLQAAAGGEILLHRQA